MIALTARLNERDEQIVTLQVGQLAAAHSHRVCSVCSGSSLHNAAGMCRGTRMCAAASGHPTPCCRHLASLL
jgi:hypothetical protein